MHKYYTELDWAHDGLEDVHGEELHEAVQSSVRDVFGSHLIDKVVVLKENGPAGGWPLISITFVGREDEVFSAFEDGYGEAEVYLEKIDQ